MARRAKIQAPRAHGPAAVLQTPMSAMAVQSAPSSSKYTLHRPSEDEEDVEEEVEEDAEDELDVNMTPMNKLTLTAAADELGADAEPAAAESAENDAENGLEKDAEADDTAVAKSKAAGKKSFQPFPFMLLPSELRLRVYAFFFQGVDPVIDLTPDNFRRIHRKLALFRTCRRVHAEASHYFYSSHVFRIFPTHPGRFFKTRRPLLARLHEAQRANLTQLELRLGPGFDKPPKCWAVNPPLGLHQCTSVRKINVFVQLDPSLSWLDGFRRKGFYEGFSKALLDDILKETPSVQVVEFDAYESVRKSSPIMQGLMQTVLDHGKKIAWGPRGRWEEDDGTDGGTAGRDPNPKRAALMDTPVPLSAGGNALVGVA